MCDVCYYISNTAPYTFGHYRFHNILNLSQFISHRILKSDDKSQISRPIVRIATVGIAIGVALMLLSLAVVKGFQQEIRNKVIGFGSHFQVTANERSYSRDSQRLTFDPQVYATLKNTPDVKHVQVFATKPGIIETKEALQGVIIKGVDKDFDWSFLQQNLVAGTPLSTDSADKKFEVIVSAYIAKRMKLAVGDKTSMYIFNDQADPRQRNFIVKGIYETGLEDFDAQFVFVSIAHVQRLSGWGLRLEAQMDSSCFGGIIPVGAFAFGGDGDFFFQCSDSTWVGEGPHAFETNHDSTIQVIVSDQMETVPDTAWLTVNYLDDASTEVCRPFETYINTAGGSDKHYIGGYEVLINSYDKLMEADDQIFASLTTKFLQTQKITDRNPEIFSWLEMLDINVYIIIILMVFISIVNMTSALLIIILERQNMIGTLKALGIQDNSVMSIFIRNAVSIIGKGMLWGNIIGIGMAFLQWKFGVVSLNPETYYVDKVPVSLDMMNFLLLNIATLIVCSICMVVPALYVLKISPVKAMRFS
jgi:lipoprotein-releasing system permease protein